ncbi:acyltransferase family protein [Streptomyces sp. NRRL B-24484]|uniref:acyltransferase family protein n=1 Tax=Streptomyces sp. NRRL B-24484 TaxID=1463833 RepID=UPI0006939DA1|nr:acyltransferase [Streptomyces sp. NRRL B-24484]
MPAALALKPSRFGPRSAPKEGTESPAPRPAVRASRLYALDGMRLFAALSVLSFHWTAYVGISGIWQGVTPREVIPLVNRAAAYGWMGVELFFVISGFVICMSCWGKRPGEFFSSRVVRLYPAYWAGVVLTSSVILLLPHLARRRAGSGLTLRTVLGNLTMLQSPLGLRPVDGVYWTLWVEMRFYLLFAVVVAMGLTYRKVVAFCGIWTIVAVVAGQVDNQLLDTVAMPQESPLFIAGMAMFLMYRFGQDLLLWGIVGFSWLLALVRIPAIRAVYVEALGHPLSWSVTAVLMTAAFALVLAAALGALDWVRWRWLTVAGALTYPLYLIHQEIGWTIIHWSLKHGLGVRSALLVALVTVLTTAWLIHRFVERPLAGRLKKGLQHSMTRLRAASDTPAAPQG